MRVLILSVTAGYGHHATARAIEDELLSRGAEVKNADLFRHISKRLFDAVDKGYLFTSKYAARSYRRVYNALESGQRLRSLISEVGGKELAQKFAYFFNGYMPDCIICTHPFAAIAINFLKEDGRLADIPAIGVVTDYTIQPFWEEVPEIEYIVTGSELLSESARMKGIDLQRLLPLGIPVQKKFSSKMDKTTARELLGLPPDGKVVLLMGGSMGYGNMLHLAARIDAMELGLQLVCICGNNQKLYNRMRLLKTKAPIRVLGFISDVDVYMDAADCIVTKPGGLTTSEALAKRLPMILVNPIPGHEERNEEFFLNNGVAVRISKNFSINEAIYFLAKNPERLRLMEESIRSISHPDATERLADFVVCLCGRGKKCQKL